MKAKTLPLIRAGAALEKSTISLQACVCFGSVLCSDLQKDVVAHALCRTKKPVYNHIKKHPSPGWCGSVD